MPEQSAAHPEPGHVPPAGEPGHFPWKIVLTILIIGKIVAQEVYDTAKALVRQLTATVQADQASIDNAKVQLAYTTIAAPIDGRTGLRLVDVGNVVRAGDSNGIVVLTQLHPISVVFPL